VLSENQVACIPAVERDLAGRSERWFGRAACVRNAVVSENCSVCCSKAVDEIAVYSGTCSAARSDIGADGEPELASETGGSPQSRRRGPDSTRASSAVVETQQATKTLAAMDRPIDHLDSRSRLDQLVV
jgi:hypothetical protein